MKTKQSLLMNPLKKWFAIGQKWFTASKKFSESFCQCDLQIPQKWFAFDEAIPPFFSLAYIHTFIHTYIHTYVHTCIRTYIHTYIHTNIHSYIHTFVLTYILTYIHTYIHTLVVCENKKSISNRIRSNFDSNLRILNRIEFLKIPSNF